MIGFLRTKWLQFWRWFRESRDRRLDAGEPGRFEAWVPGFPGEKDWFTAHELKGGHLYCADDGGRFPEGVLLQISDAVNRAAFRRVFKEIWDRDGIEMYYGDGTPVSPDDVVG